MVSSSDDSDIKIIDFGLAHTDVFDESCRGRVGSAYYMAPEIVANQLYGKPVDIWSFGVILYLLLFGQVPFNGKTKDELSRAIIEGELVFPQQSPVSKEARDFVRRVLNKNPAERLTAAEALGHNWIYRSLSISTVDLSETKRNLCRFQMKRKLRKFFFVILAIVILLKKLKKVREIHQSSSLAEIIDEEETKVAATVESV